MRLHRREVSVVVQQPVAALYALRADDDVRRLADRHAQRPQCPVVPGRARGETAIQQRHDGKLAQPAFETGGVKFVPRSLQNLK